VKRPNAVRALMAIKAWIRAMRERSSPPTLPDRVTILTQRIATWAREVADLRRNGAPAEDVESAAIWLEKACVELDEALAEIYGGLYGGPAS
jgi:hypothetical protein